jgi:hypothetical protein
MAAEIKPGHVSGKGFCSLAAFAASCRGMVSLSDPQLKIITTAASAVPVDRRSVFLERIAAMLRMRGYGHFTNSDVSDVAKLALTGLTHQPAA